MCTLTGAQGISTGRSHAAHLTNSEVNILFRDEFIGPKINQEIIDSKNQFFYRHSVDNIGMGRKSIRRWP